MGIGQGSGDGLGGLRQQQGEPEDWTQGQLLAYARDLSRMYRELKRAHEELESTYLSTLIALAAAIDARDSYLVGHSRSIESLALRVGQEMGLDAARLTAIQRAALLHDIGKIGLPDSILGKPGPLDPNEWGLMRRHPEIGFRILSSLRFLGDALLGIRHHHERYDGSGYPAGLRGEEIPLIARILAVCDAFDAMISDRVYRPAMEVSQACEEILKGRGTQFDPEVADLFVRLVRTGDLGRPSIMATVLQPPPTNGRVSVPVSLLAASGNDESMSGLPMSARRTARSGGSRPTEA